MSIFPEVTAGGLVIRDELGAPTNPAGVQNAYVPAPAYIITCPPTALPSDCTARIEPKQINSIASELLALAECMDPDGPWNCNSVTNLCAAFTVWVTTGAGAMQVGDGVSILGVGTPADPFTVGTVDCGVWA